MHTPYTSDPAGAFLGVHVALGGTLALVVAGRVAPQPARRALLGALALGTLASVEARKPAGCGPVIRLSRHTATGRLARARSGR